MKYRDIITLKIESERGIDHSKAVASVAPGARVRVKARSVSERQRFVHLVGSIVTLSADALVLKLEKQTMPLAIPLASVMKLETSRGKKRNKGKGALIGLWVGGSFGAVLGLMKGDDPDPNDWLSYTAN